MAKAKINKSQLIRDALRKHKKKSPLEISAVLKTEHNLQVSAQYISTIKSKMKVKSSAHKLSSRVPIAASGADGGALFAAAELVVKAGGVAQARAALDAVAKVASIME